MCGISGIISYSDKTKNCLSDIEKSLQRLINRGPDSSGKYLHENVALGHRRLKLLDLSSAADQPMHSSDNNYSIVFNGEIYNYKELKKEFADAGVDFNTSSDTEVILQMYIYKGLEFIAQLEGEFAIAIYDKKKNEIHLIRDRYGIKPLYYYHSEDLFIFSSLISGITAFSIHKEIDQTALSYYFQFNYIPSPLSIFKNIRKLAAGHSITISTDKRPEYLTPVAYYQLEVKSDCKDESVKILHKIKNLLTDSVKSRMHADVPVGVFLSGGIDSTVIATLASKFTGQLNTYSLAYKNHPFYNEHIIAENTAKKIGSRHRTFWVDSLEVENCIPEILNNIDEPFADSSMIPYYILSKHTAREVKAVLTGDGADEVFGGYNKHKAELILKSRKYNPFLNIIDYLPFISKGNRSSGLGTKIRKLKKLSDGNSLTAKERYVKWASFIDNITHQKLLKQNILSQSDYLNVKEKITHSLNDDFNSYLLCDMKLVLENDMLVKADRMSMQNSLEVRTPFLNHCLVDYAFSIPASMKTSSNDTKKILKECFNQELSSEVLQKKKTGFEIPASLILNCSYSKKIITKYLNEEYIQKQNIFHYPAIESIISKAGKEINDYPYNLWALIVFQSWYAKNFKHD